MTETILTHACVVKFDGVVLSGFQHLRHVGNEYHIQKLTTKGDPLIIEGQWLRVTVEAEDVIFSHQYEVVSCMPNVEMDDVFRTIIKLKPCNG